MKSVKISSRPVGNRNLQRLVAPDGDGRICGTLMNGNDHLHPWEVCMNVTVVAALLLSLATPLAAQDRIADERWQIVWGGLHCLTHLPCCQQ
jgi:hypothetical protein